jgi:hypothetical protein
MPTKVKKEMPMAIKQEAPSKGLNNKYKGNDYEKYRRYYTRAGST